MLGDKKKTIYRILKTKTDHEEEEGASECV